MPSTLSQLHHDLVMSIVNMIESGELYDCTNSPTEGFYQLLEAGIMLINNSTTAGMPDGQTYTDFVTQARMVNVDFVSIHVDVIEEVEKVLNDPETEYEGLRHDNEAEKGFRDWIATVVKFNKLYR